MKCRSHCKMAVQMAENKHMMDERYAEKSFEVQAHSREPSGEGDAGAELDKFFRAAITHDALQVRIGTNSKPHG